MKKLILCSFGLLLLTKSYAQMSGSAIDQLTERTLKAFYVPGAAVAVIKDGKVIHSKGYGVRSLRTGLPVDENTVFGIASNTKAFTAAAMGILVDEGKLHWDDKVRDYIPEFKLYDPYVSDAFTIRDLLAHHSGLGPGAGDLMIFPDSSDFTVKDVIYNLRFLKPVRGFRTHFDYSNELYTVAGEVIARASGMSYEDFIEQRIMAPLGMNHSAAAFGRLKDTADVIDAHILRNGKATVIQRNAINAGHPAGGVNASLSDLEKWVLMQLADGKYGTAPQHQLFSSSVHRQMWSPQTIAGVAGPGPYNTHFSAYGMGWGISDITGGYIQVRHTGGLDGMVSQITIVPELGLGIIVLTNQEEPGAFIAITNQIKDGYLGIKGIDRIAENVKKMQAKHEYSNKVKDSVGRIVAQLAKNNVGSSVTTLYTGTFKDSWLGEVRIGLNKGKLWFASKRSPKLSGELLHYKGTTFVARWTDRGLNADAFVMFRLDENGKASGFSMKAISPDTDFSYDYQDLDFYRE